MVCSAETLRAIQVEWGLTGSFKDKPIAEWLAKHNPSELEYERAVTNFTGNNNHVCYALLSSITCEENTSLQQKTRDNRMVFSRLVFFFQHLVPATVWPLTFWVSVIDTMITSC